MTLFPPHRTRWGVRWRSAAPRGFTLVEVAVTILILSVVAAMVFPIVIGQSGRADPVRIAHDLASVRTGVDLFHLQTRTAYPRRLPDLATPITVGALSLDSVPYTASEASRWSGPYLEPVLASAGANIRTAAGVEIRNTFAFFDLETNCARTASNRAADDYVAIRTLSMTWDTFQAVNDIFDGEAEPDGYGPGFSTHLGKFRMNDCPQPINTATPTGPAYLLVRPY
jgi:prepilin-type N-terminal cleavage/methylation domain-containing protein